nr:hypothetical protein [Desulfobacter postgatei]
MHQIDGQTIDLQADSQPYISIPESEYLELRNQVGYWKGMHQKALLREEGLKQEIKKKMAKSGILKNRLFGKKPKRDLQKQKKPIQNQMKTKGLVVNNLEVKVTA